MSRLKEIKEHVKWTTEKGIVPRIEDSDLDWLIQQAEILEQNKDVVKSIVGEEVLNQDGNYETEMMKLRKRVKELEEESKNKAELLGEIFLHHHWLKVGGISDKKFMNFMDEVSQKIYELNEIGGEDENE